MLSVARADQVAVHEMAHCLSLAVNPGFGNNPRWLWETVAVYEAGEFVDPRTVPALVAGQPPTLAELDADVTAGQLVDQVGHTLGEFVVARAGREGLAALIGASGNTQAVLGLSPDAFVREWYAFVRALPVLSRAVDPVDSSGGAFHTHGMSTRLQVLLDDAELREIRAVARRKRLTVAEWVRQALRDARRGEPRGDVARKLAAVRAGARHGFPAPDVDRMLAEIEQGYLGKDR